MLGRQFFCFCRFNLFHFNFFSSGFSSQYLHLFFAICIGHFTHFFNTLFFDSDCFIHYHTLANNIGDFFLLHFNRFLSFNGLQLYFALTRYNFQVTRTGYLLFFNRDCTQTVLRSNINFTLLVFSLYREVLRYLNRRLLVFASLFFLHLFRFRFFSGLNCGYLTFLTRFCIRLLALKSQHSFSGFYVFLFDGQLFITLQNIGANVLCRRQFSNFFDAFRIENIIWIKRRFWRLLDIVDSYIFQHITIEVITNDFDNFFAEFQAVFKQLDKFNLLADGF